MMICGRIISWPGVLIILMSAWLAITITASQDESCKNVAKPVAPPCWTCDRCENGQWECDPVTCASDQCVDGYFTETNMCCQMCPNGENCKFTDVIIPINRTVSVGGVLCACVESEDGSGLLMAKCI